MKKIIVTLQALCVLYLAQAQVKVGDNPTAIHPSSLLELESANKGVLFPRVTLMGANAVVQGLYYSDGSTTFNLPDLRGEFICGWDNGRGVDADRALATFQSGATQLPGTAFTGTTSSYTHNHGVGDGSNAANYVNQGSTGLSRRSVSGEYSTICCSPDNGGAGAEPDVANVPRVIPDDSHSHTVALNGGGDAETRPRNVAMVYAIKAVESILVLSSTSSAIEAAAVSEPWYKVATTSGATSNTDDVYITGKVGIGLNNPIQKLDVGGNLAHAVISVSSVTDIDFRITNGASATGSVSRGDFGGDATQPAWFFVRVLSPL